MKFNVLALVFLSLTAASQAQIDALTDEGKRLCQVASPAKADRFKFLQAKLNECTLFHSGSEAAECQKLQKVRINEFYGQCVDAKTRATGSQNRANSRNDRQSPGLY